MTAQIPSFGRTGNGQGGLSFLKYANSTPELLIPFGLQLCRGESIPWTTTPLDAKLKDYTLVPPVLFPKKRLKQRQPPPLSPESKNLLDCPQPRGHAQWGLWAWPPGALSRWGEPLSRPLLCASSRFSRAVDLVKVKASSERCESPRRFCPVGEAFSELNLLW